MILPYFQFFSNNFLKRQSYNFTGPKLEDTLVFREVNLTYILNHRLITEGLVCAFI